MIRKAIAIDLEYIAQIHKKQFADHYLGKFSPGLIRKFYEKYLSEESIIFLVYEINNKVEGFVMGGFSDKLNLCSNMFLKTCINDYLFEILCRPRTWLDTFIRLMSMVKSKFSKKTEKSSVPRFRLLSISVNKHMQGRGVAKELVLAFENAVPKLEDTYGLTVHANNYRAIKFYTKMGFIKEREIRGSISLFKKIK